MNAIEISSLKKTYDTGDKALKGIDLSIKQGSFFGLLGPNGAGKTTTIGIMTGLVNITSGSVEVMGHDVIKDYKKSRKLIGLSPQELNFDVFFPIKDVLALNAGYYGLPNKEAYERADIMLEQFGLTGILDFAVTSLDVGFEKPNKIIFEHAITMADTLASNVIYVGDQIESDVMGAINVGINPILIDRDQINTKWSKCPVINDIDQLDGVIEKTFTISD